MSSLQAEQLQEGADAQSLLQGGARSEDGWVFLDRDDIFAFSPPDVIPNKSVYYEIWNLFSEVNPKYVGNKMTVVYLGSIEPELKTDGSIFGYRFPMLDNFQYFDKQSEYTGTGVMWASMETQSLYYIDYPKVAADGALVLRKGSQREDSGSAVDSASVVQEFDARDEGPSFLEVYGGAQVRGVVRLPDNRHRIFSENSPVSGKMFQRMLSIGRASGSLIGPRHGLTAAHVMIGLDGPNKTLLIDNETVRAGRNGNTQIGSATHFRHLYWHATWTPSLASRPYVGQDFAWGVLDAPLGDDAGYFGYSWRTLDELQAQGHTLRNVGYPSCDDDPVPEGCIDHHLYMDSNACETGLVEAPDLQGAEQSVQHACDTSPGHSGSPLILTKEGSLYVWAVHGNAGGSWNYAARITPHRSLDLIEEMYRNFPRD